MSAETNNLVPLFQLGDLVSRETFSILEGGKVKYTGFVMKIDKQDHPPSVDDQVPFRFWIGWFNRPEYLRGTTWCNDFQLDLVSKVDNP